MTLNKLLLGMITFFALFGGRVHATELSTTASNMQPGTWEQLAKPGNFFVQVGLSTTTLHFMGQGTWDSVKKQVVFLGTPHGGNSKLHIYDDATNSWIEGTQIIGFPTGWSHGYNHNAISITDRVLGLLRLTDATLSFREFNLDTRTWTIKGSTANDGHLAHALVYFPERSRWYVPDGTYGKLREYNRTNDTWSVFSSGSMDCYGPGVGGYDHQFANYNPTKNLIAFGGGSNYSGDYSTSWCTMDASGNIASMPPSPHTLRIPNDGDPTRGSLITTDPVSGDLIILTQTGLLYRFDFNTKQWIAVNDSSTRPAFFNQTSRNVSSSFVVPIDTYGVIMYGKFDGPDTQIWLYKHAAGTGTPPPSPPPSGDTTPPTTPQGLNKVSTTSSQISLAWSPSTDNLAVTGYEISRGNTLIGTSSTVSYQDSGLTASTAYVYSVKAFDAAGNRSAASSPLTITTEGSASSPPPPPPSATGTINRITIHESSGTTQNNRPVSIARAFRQGEIPNFAQAKIGNTALLTQCDVKNRWPDGSLKFAIVSFVIPSVSGNDFRQIDFVNQPSGQNTGFLTQAEMLGSGYNFDGAIQMAGGATRTVNARTMLNNGHFRYWLKGPIVTAVILEDRSTARSYDQDFGDGSKALHPIYEAWFYPQGNRVQLGYTMENIWASSESSKGMRDLAYSIVLKSGNNNPTTEWSHGSFNHIGRTRWHKVFWLGTDPGAIRVDHNLAYLVTTGAIPHYDPSLSVSTTPESNRYATFTQYKDTLDGSDGGDSNRIGNYHKQMNMAGANDWIGLHNTWEVLWLYSMSSEGYKMLLGNADLAGRMPFHFREADTLAGTGDYFDQTYQQNPNLSSPGTSTNGGTVDTSGRIISINARRTSHLSTYNDTASSGEDRIATGSVTNDGWGTFGIERNHEPDVCSMAYLFSGRYYYLECLQMQGAFNIAWNPAGWGSHWARPGDIGLLNDTNIRGDAWGLKTLVYASFLSPDNTPEQKYFLDKLKDNITEWEGVQNLPLSYPSKSEVWNYGRNVRTKETYWKLPGGQPSPLGQWSPGHPAFVQSPLLKDGSLSHGTSPWEENFMLCVLGMANQMGVVDSKGLLQFMAKKRFHLNLDSINDPNTSLNNFVEAYRDPTIESATGNWVQTWDSFVSHYQKNSEPYTQRGNNLTSDHSYAFIALAADSFLTLFTVDGLNGMTAYQANKAATPNQNRFETSSPKWAITPMSSTQNTPPPDTVPPSPPTNLQLQIQ